MGQLFKIFIIAFGLYYFIKLIGKALRGNGNAAPRNRQTNYDSSNDNGNDDDGEYVDYEEVE